MPVHSLLPFGQPTREKRQGQGGGGGKVIPPDPSKQKERLEKKFRDIIKSFETVQTTIEGITPEQVIVLETLGKAEDELAKAASKIAGLEWLAELDLEEKDSCDGFTDAEEPTKKLSHRLYAVMTNQKAMSDLLTLWKKWTDDPTKRADPGYGPFKNIFIYLKDVRRWSAKDRIEETGILDDWAERLRHETKPLKFEVELWCRKEEGARAQAYARLETLIAKEGGRCIAQAAVPQIVYHGVLAELPAKAVQETLEKIRASEFTELLRSEDVMFFRPQGQAILPAVRDDGESVPVEAPPALDVSPEEPTVALFDGYPLIRHAILDGRLRVHDPDELAQFYEPRKQLHGTAMASLILQGDLNKEGEALRSALYVRPILVPDSDLNGEVFERTPDNVLLVDLFHRAVLQMKGDEKTPGAAPRVQIINLSFGNTFQPFDRNVTPLAKLLDWLSWKYNVLFLVSAGNQMGNVKLDVPSSSWRNLSDDKLRQEAIKALWKEQVFRRPFSPAESINSVTVGAWHEDNATIAPHERRVDLWKGASFPSPISTVSCGFNQSAKPEVFFPGGKVLFSSPVIENDEPAVFRASRSTSPPGLRVGCPGVGPMELNRSAHSYGTSNATALATRFAALARKELKRLQGESGWDSLTEDYFPVLLKSLLVHGASWGNSAQLIDEVFKPHCENWQALERVRMRFLGYGAADQDRALAPNDQRAILLGWDTIKAEEGHVFRFPLPKSLAAKKVHRRFSVSLAWFSPINPFHSAYRKAALWFSVVDNSKKFLKVDKAGLDAKSSQRGTVQHQVFEGESATVFKETDEILIKVSCVEDAGKLTEGIRYGLVASLEVAEETGIPILGEIAAQIRPAIPVQTGGRPATS